MATRVWVRTFGRADEAALPAQLADTSGEQWALAPYAPGTDGPGLVAFDLLDEAVLAFVTQASQGGRARVLALPLGACASGQVRRLLAAGAADVLPVTSAGRLAEALAARLARWAEIDALLAGPAVGARLIGQSPDWWRALRLVVEVARFTDAAALLTGESGTGKELAARLIHDLDPRDHKGAFVVVDCTTVVPELAGSEFFGHERGAFTGAVSQRDGAFALADGGTLFLDEIGDLPLPLQAQLLRVIQEGTYKRVGGNAWYQTRFRLVSATHRDLAARVQAGAFRADLYFRLAAVPIRLPPLRQRRADVLPLARHFIAEACGERPTPELDPVVAELLTRRAYPGNIRELRQVIARLMHRWPGVGPLTAGCIAEADWPEPPATAAAAAGDDDALVAGVRERLAAGHGLRDIGRTAEDIALRLVLDEEDGNLQRAARRLGVTDRALQLRRQGERRLAGHGANG